MCALGFPSLRGRSTEWRPPEESQSTERKQEGMCVPCTTATVTRTTFDGLSQGVAERARPEVQDLGAAVPIHIVQRASWGHRTIRRRLSRLSIARKHSDVSTACVLLAQKIICYSMVVDARCELGASRAPVGANTLTPVQPSLLVMSLLNVLRCGRESVSKKKVTPA